LKTYIRTITLCGDAFDREITMPPIVTAMRWTLLVASIFVASCAELRNANDSQGQFGIVTSEGTVLATVDGSATGYTHNELTQLIRKGVAETYGIQRAVVPGTLTSGARMIWHVTNDEREPTAIISVDFIRDGKITRSAFTNAAAPGSEPDAVFMGAVSQLAENVLPPANRQPGSSSIGSL
jgi:hypothetical protein